jgi:hypothetical protein
MVVGSQPSSVALLIEIATPEGVAPKDMAREVVARVHGLVLDEGYDPVAMRSSQGATYVFRATAEVPDVIESARKLPGVVGVWRDTRIQPF